MSKVDWSQMTANEIWEAFSSAPQVASPWDTEGSDSVSIRWSQCGERIAQVEKLGPFPCEYEYVEGYWEWQSQEDEGEHPVREEAMRIADEHLRAEGWMLATDEKEATNGIQDGLQ